MSVRSQQLTFEDWPAAIPNTVPTALHCPTPGARVPERFRTPDYNTIQILTHLVKRMFFKALLELPGL